MSLAPCPTLPWGVLVHLTPSTPAKHDILDAVSEWSYLLCCIRTSKGGPAALSNAHAHTPPSTACQHCRLTSILQHATLDETQPLCTCCSCNPAPHPHYSPRCRLRIYHYYLPVYFWIEQQLQQHKAQGGPHTALVVSAVPAVGSFDRKGGLACSNASCPARQARCATRQAAVLTAAPQRC